MRTHLLNLTAGGALLAAVLAAAAPAGAAEHVAIKRPVDVAPSADLIYSIKARQKGFSLSGEAIMHWRVTNARYSLRIETRAILLGTIIENRSDGLIDGFGIAPTRFYEKRIRREAVTTTFNRQQSISFTEGNQTLPADRRRTGPQQHRLAGDAARAAPRNSPRLAMDLLRRRPPRCRAMDAQGGQGTIRTGLAAGDAAPGQLPPPGLEGAGARHLAGAGTRVVSCAPAFHRPRRRIRRPDAPEKGHRQSRSVPAARHCSF
jgi:hypothetical protein